MAEQKLDKEQWPRLRSVARLPMAGYGLAMEAESLGRQGVAISIVAPGRPPSAADGPLQTGTVIVPWQAFAKWTTMVLNLEDEAE